MQELINIENSFKNFYISTNILTDFIFFKIFFLKFSSQESILN